MKAFKIIGAVILGIIVIAVIANAGKGNTSPAATSSGITPGYVTPAQSEAPRPSPTPSGPLTTIDAGTYHVGDEIAAGRWTTPGPEADSIIKLCTWQRARNDSGEASAFITGGTLGEKSNGSVTIKAGEFLVLSGPCTWARK